MTASENNNNNENSNSVSPLSTSLSLKVARGEDIRRVAFDGSSSLLSLHEIVAKLYGIEDSASIVLKYGDVVLTSDSELQEAVKEVKESKVLRLSLETKSTVAADENMEESEEDEDVMRPFGRFKHGRRFQGHRHHGGPFAFQNPGYGPHYYHHHGPYGHHGQHGPHGPFGPHSHGPHSHGPHSHGPRSESEGPLAYGPLGHRAHGPHSHGPHSHGPSPSHGPHHAARGPFGPYGHHHHAAAGGPHGPFGHGPRFYGHHGPYHYQSQSQSQPQSSSEGVSVNVNVNVPPSEQEGHTTSTFHSPSDFLMFNNGSFSPIDPTVSSPSLSGCEKANKKWEKYQKRCEKFNKNCEKHDKKCEERENKKCEKYNKKCEERENKKCEKYNKKCEKYDKKSVERESYNTKKWEERCNKKWEEKLEKKCERKFKKCGKMNKWGAFERGAHGRTLNAEDEKAIEEAKERMLKLRMEMKAAKRHYIWTLRNAGAPTVENTTEAAAKMSLSDDVVATA